MEFFYILFFEQIFRAYIVHKGIIEKLSLKFLLLILYAEK